MSTVQHEQDHTQDYLCGEVLEAFVRLVFGTGGVELNEVLR